MKHLIRYKTKFSKNKYSNKMKKDNTVEMKTNNVDRSHVTIVQWENDKDQHERLISWNDEYGGQQIVVQMQLTRCGRNWVARIEEWDAESPELLRKGNEEIRLKNADDNQ